MTIWGSFSGPILDENTGLKTPEENNHQKLEFQGSSSNHENSMGRWGSSRSIACESADFVVSHHLTAHRQKIYLVMAAARISTFLGPNWWVWLGVEFGGVWKSTALSSPVGTFSFVMQIKSVRPWPELKLNEGHPKLALEKGFKRGLF